MPPRTNYISWDECFMRMAHIISLRSKDPSTQVGAVIVDPSNIVVGLGYNGFPRGVDDQVFPWGREGNLLDTKYPYVCHAEINSILNSNAPTKNCKMYTSLFPCNECSKAIIQKGISEIIYESDKYKEQDIFVAARRMLEAVGIKLRQYTSEYTKEKTTV